MSIRRKLFFVTSKVPKIPGFVVVFNIALFIALLVVVFVTNALPTEVEQKTTLLNYEHSGRFDYLINLKPSTLFGPPPQKPPPNPKYPTAIVDSIELTFRYSPTVPETEVVSINAALENEGIWYKEYGLVPYTSKTGEFTLRFMLDLDEIEALFANIEDQIGIRSLPHHLAIKAYVSAPKEVFVQSLPIVLDRNLIEIDANLKHTQACGSGEFDYTVNLKENSIFDVKTLKPPPVPETPSSSKTLKPGEVIFANLIDKMEVTYYYQFKSYGPVNQVNTDAYITVSIGAKDLWSKSFPITSARGDENLKLSFPLDFFSYIVLAQTIRSETGAAGESNNITTTADVHTTAETQFGLIDEGFSQSMTGTIEGGILEWGEKLSQSKSGSIETSSVIPNPNRYMGLSVIEVRILSTALTIILFLSSLLAVVLYIMSRPLSPSAIEMAAARIGKKYGQHIAEATRVMPVEGEEVISLGSMEDLVKIADELGKPIVHQAPVTFGEVHAYYVFDEDTRYQYVLTEYRKE